MKHMTILMPTHDTLAIEAEARRLRAEFIANFLGALALRVAALFDTSAQSKVRG